MNDYLYLFSPRYSAQPYMDFAAGLRVEEPPAEKSKPKKLVVQPFSFYQRDLEHWQQRISKYKSRRQSPLRVFDVDTKGNPGAVFTLIVTSGDSMST